MPDDTLPRFTILEHDHPFLHWDLLMENGEALLAWRLLQKPAQGEWISSERLPNHRQRYLDYEGPVSNNRGVVSQFCTGRFSCHQPGTVIDDSINSAFDLFDCSFASTLVRRPTNHASAVWRFE